MADGDTAAYLAVYACYTEHRTHSLKVANERCSSVPASSSHYCQHSTVTAQRDALSSSKTFGLGVSDIAYVRNELLGDGIQKYRDVNEAVPVQSTPAACDGPQEVNDVAVKDIDSAKEVE
jgi:hypothetical protein